MGTLIKKGKKPSKLSNRKHGDDFDIKKLITPIKVTEELAKQVRINKYTPAF